MTPVSRVRINQWRCLNYHDPAKILRQFPSDTSFIPNGGQAPGWSSFRTRPKRPLMEMLDAAVFAYGVSVAVPTVQIHIARFEDQDHDFVIRFAGPDDDYYYCPLQMKELVPPHVNPDATLESLLDSLDKYRGASDMVVAVKLNRPGYDLTAIKIPPLDIGELWFFGATNHREWFLYGDCLQSPSFSQFIYPA